MKTKSFQYAALSLIYRPLRGKTVTDRTLVALPARMKQNDLDDFLAELSSRDVLAIEHGIPNPSPVSHPEEANDDHHPWVTIAGLEGVAPPKKKTLKQQPPLEFEPIMSSLLDGNPVETYYPIRLAYLHQRAVLGLEQAADALAESGIAEFDALKEQVDHLITQTRALSQ